MEDLVRLADAMQEAVDVVADDSASQPSSSSTFMHVVALGNVGAGKSATLNSLIGHPVLPTGENGATRAPILIDMEQDASVSNRGLLVVLENKTQEVSASTIRHSLQDRLSKGTSSGKGGHPDEISIRLRSRAAPPLKLIDLPGLDHRASDEKIVNAYTEHTDAILLVVIPAAQAPEVSSSRALRISHDLDPDGTRTVGVISKVDQVASDQRSLAAVQALLLGKGPSTTSDIPWVALIGQSVAIAAAQSGSVGSESTLDTAWRAEMESLKSILGSAPQTQLGRNALVDTIAKQIRKRLTLRLPSLLSGLGGRSELIEEELARLGEHLVETAEGTRALALELCREFEDKFLQHIETGEGAGWKVVASFESGFPNRIKQLPLDDLFEISNVKKVVLEADGYQPYLISPEKGLRALIRRVLELAKEPAQICVDEVHRILVDIVSSAAASTPGLGRFPPFKREIVTIASSALDDYRAEAKKMVMALVDMERAFIPPQHFIRLVQRRLDRLRREDELKHRQSRKAQEVEQSLLSRSATPPPQSGNQTVSLKSAKDKSGTDKDTKETSNLKVAGPSGELTAGYLYKRSSKKKDWIKRWFVYNEKTRKLGYTKKPDEQLFRGVINLEECVIEDASGSDLADEAPPTKSKSSKSSSSPDKASLALAFKISNKVSYKTIVKARHSLVLKAENVAEKQEWLSKMNIGAVPKGGSSNQAPTVESAAPSMHKTMSEGSLDTMTRRPSDPEEDLKIMAQEVRDYVEAVLNSLAANVPKAVVLCQVERAKDDMLIQLYSSISSQATEKMQELLEEDKEVKRRRERCRRQASMLSRLTHLLSSHESHTSTNGGDYESADVAPIAEDWRSAFEAGGMSNGEYSQNGDMPSNKRTPSRMPPPPPRT